MSTASLGFCGIYALNGQSNDLEFDALERIARTHFTGAVSTMAFDGIKTVSVVPDNPVLLQLLVRHSSHDHSLILGLGRVDQTDMGATPIAGDVRKAERLLDAYRRRGPEFASDVLGDFALVVTDSRAHRLTLTRDFLGIYSLYYATVRQVFVFSTSPLIILDFLSGGAEVNRSYLAHYLTNETYLQVNETRPLHTAFVGVCAVRPGTAVSVDRNGHFLISCWYHQTDVREIRYKTDLEYEEHFLSLFKTSVERRFLARSRTWCEVSGGVDSSAVYGAAHMLAADDLTAERVLHSVSYVDPDSNNKGEIDMISLVTNDSITPATLITPNDCASLFLLESTSINSPSILPASRYLWNVRDRMREDGALVLLSGLGGDFICWSHQPVPLTALDALHEMHIPSLHRLLRAYAHSQDTGYWTLLRQISSPWIAYRKTGRFRGLGNTGPAPFLSATFVEQFGLRDVAEGPPFADRTRRPTFWLRQNALLSIRSYISNGFLQTVPGIQIWVPFLDRELVDFCLGVPMDQHFRPGEPRRLQRNALRSVLPHPIAERKGKASPHQTLLAMIEREAIGIERLMKNALIYDFGFAHAERLRSEFTRLKHGCDEYLYDFLRILCLEVWLRAVRDKYPGVC